MKLSELKGKRIFDVDLGIDDFYDNLASMRIAIDQKVIDEALSQDWKDTFYDLKNAEGVAAHIARNMFINDDYSLSASEGFHGMNSSLIEILIYPQVDWIADAREIDVNKLHCDAE
jgi:hypothetical protein